MRTEFWKNERGSALLETAITMPIILLITVGIFEFGRAYQTQQVLTNAAREGARIAILSETTDEQVLTRVRDYMSAGQLPQWEAANVNVERNVAVGTNSASRITITYPFEFMVLNPVVQLVTPGSSTGSAIDMQSQALMRNEI